VRIISNSKSETRQQGVKRPERRGLGRLKTPVAAIVASVAFFGLVAAGGAHVNGPTVTALHAFIGDPLLGLDTAEGTLFGISPDEQTAMGSTTKIWTLDLTAHALAQGKVHLDDKVTITPFEASFGPGNSLMTDVNGKSLEAGEVVRLRDLVRGMMYPSGNDAAYAIARHVGQAYLGPSADWKAFVGLMNNHAADAGMTHTHYTNPAGVDIGSHYTTARELAEQIQHGLQDPYFAQVVGFQGTYTATTQGPNGTKSYSWNWGNGYPGWEGEKGGSTPKCNGPANGCIVRAATRIGRRVVVATMQGTAGAEENGMLDFGFESVFHPDWRGLSAPWGTVSRQDLDCLDNRRTLSAVLPPSGPVSLILGQPNVDNSSIAKLQEASLPGSGYVGRQASGDVAVTHLSSSDFVMATRTGSNVQLSRWTIARDGTLMLLVSSINAGSATTMGLQAVYGDTFLTSMTEPGGDLVLKSWRLQGTGLALLDTYKDDSHTYTEVAVAGPLTTDVLNGHRAVTAALGIGVLVQDVWGVDQATGAISRLGELKDWGTKSNVTISPFVVNAAFDGEFSPPVYYATAYRRYGYLEIRFNRIDATGTPVDEGSTWPSNTIPVDRVRLVPLGTGGLMSAIRDPQGNVRLVAWDAPRNADDKISPDSISEHETHGSASSLDLCRVPSAHAEGDYVTATTDNFDGQLRLRAYRSGDRPY